MHILPSSGRSTDAAGLVRRRRAATGIVAVLGLTFGVAHTVRADGDSPSSPNNSVRLGLYAVFYHTSADDISGPYVPAGVNVKVENLNTLYLAYSRSLTTHFELELAAGYPPLAKTEGRGPTALGSVPYNGQVISTARWIAPTLLLNYRFFDENTAVRPYVGAGVNYTTFYDRESTAAGDAANGGPTRLSLTASVGPAAEVGVSWRVARHLSFYASYAISDVHSNLVADTAGVIRTTHVNFGPQVLVLSAGYLF
jgi:outer membrane protein